MNSSRKRYWIIAGLVALLILTGYVNYRLNQPDENAPALEALAPAGLPEQADSAPQQQQMEIEVDGNPVPDTPEQEALAQAGSAGYFTSFRLDRDRTRAVELEVLQGIITDANTSAELIADAQAQKLSLVDSMEKEMTIEGIIKAKGFNEAAVSIHKGSVNVVVDKDNLSDSDVAQILDVAMRESGEKPENIKVMPKS